ncbi:MAG TPA: FAD:protein FMN transferase [Lachnospiraceae bacterium]|nr:FAD:protein FMN transferase [Lachnospiraceae bacterium]
MKRKIKKSLFIAADSIFLFAIIAFVTGCGLKQAQFTAVGTAMGTVITQHIDTKGENITGNIMDIITSLEQDCLSYRISESEVGNINAQAGSGNFIALSKELNADLTTCFDVSVKSEGAFDITVGPVTRLWNIDAWASGENTEQKIPEPEQISNVLSQTGFDKIEYVNGNILLPEGMSLDLGAVGKGIACDRIADYLDTKEVKGAVISVGGSILTYGEKARGVPWTVGIVNPQNTVSSIGTVSVSGEWYVSTSGDYERYMEVDGKRYHHIIDPHTGYPTDSGLSSVTIVCKSGILSDALSTACFVLGEKEGMELADYYDVAVLFVNTEGKLVMNRAMETIFRQTKEN